MGKIFKQRQQPDPGSESERRRVGTVVHDDRGYASVSWRDSPAGDKRPVLEILGADATPLGIKSDDSHDPYAHGHTRSKPRADSARTDLRKLSEHIKKMRELEERKRNEGGEND